MKYSNNVTIAVLAGVVVGTLLGAGTSQYAYVIASYDPSDAKTFVEEPYHGAPTTNRATYTNSRALRLNLEGFRDEAFLEREREAVRRDAAEYDETRYATEGKCEGLSGNRRHVCEAEADNQ